MIPRLAAESSPRESDGFGPEGAGRMRRFHDIPCSRNESIDLPIGYYQWRRDFQHHEVVSAHLREKSEVPKQPHDEDLSKHSGMNRAESFVWNAQPQLPRRLELDPYEQTNPADFFHHLKVAQHLAEPVAQVNARVR